MNIRKLAITLLVITTMSGLLLGLILLGLQPPDLPVPPKTRTTIRDVTLINPGRERLAHVDIDIADGRILSVRQASANPAPSEISCRGCFALPGLMDMHAHMPPMAAIGNERLFSLLFLANGVTTIREMGSADGSAYQIRDSIAAGAWPGPRVMSCGRVLDGDPPTRSNNVVVTTPREGRAEVVKAATQGARCIKLYNMLKKDVVLAIADEASKWNLPIVAHVPHSVSLLDAPFIADVQHFTGVPVPADPAAVGIDDYLNSDFANLTDDRIRDVVAAAKRLHTIHTPALINEDVRRTLGDPRLYPPHKQLSVLPSFWTAVWRGIWNAPNLGPEDAIYEGFLRRERDLLKTMFQSGITIYAGTDTLMPFVSPGASLLQELQNFVDVGQTPESALITATTSPGQFWKGQTMGTIAPGLPADIVLYASDPTRSLAYLETRQWIIADGRIYSRKTLDAWIECYRQHFHGWMYQTVMDVILQFVTEDYEKGKAGKSAAQVFKDRRAR